VKPARKAKPETAPAPTVAVSSSRPAQAPSARAAGSVPAPAAPVAPQRNADGLTKAQVKNAKRHEKKRDKKDNKMDLISDTVRQQPQGSVDAASSLATASASVSAVAIPQQQPAKQTGPPVGHFRAQAPQAVAPVEAPGSVGAELWF